MKKVNYLLFAGLTVMVIYTVFAVQNRVSVPVRLTFGDPAVYSLPIVVLVSFIGGAVFAGLLIAIYHLSLAKLAKSRISIWPGRQAREEYKNNILEKQEDSANLDKRIREQIENILGNAKEASS